MESDSKNCLPETDDRGHSGCMVVSNGEFIQVDVPKHVKEAISNFQKSVEPAARKALESYAESLGVTIEDLEDPDLYRNLALDLGLSHEDYKSLMKGIRDAGGFPNLDDLLFLQDRIVKSHQTPISPGPKAMASRKPGEEPREPDFILDTGPEQIDLTQLYAAIGREAVAEVLDYSSLEEIKTQIIQDQSIDFESLECEVRNSPRENELIKAMASQEPDEGLYDLEFNKAFGLRPNVKITEEEKEILARLDDQERKMLRFWNEGEINSEIGKRLHLQARTVTNKISTIRKKVGVKFCPYRKNDITFT